MKSCFFSNFAQKIVILSMLLAIGCGGTLRVDVPHSNSRSYDDVLNSVVALVEVTPGGLQGPTCTAFFISETDLVTAGHCILEATITLTLDPNNHGQPRPVIRFEDPERAIGKTVHFITQRQYERWASIPESRRPRNPEIGSARVLAVLSPINSNGTFGNDIALLRISGQTPRSRSYLEVRNWQSEPPRTGENAYAVGLPVGEPWVLTRGIISRINIDRAGLVQVWHDARIGHGSSGSPLLDERGRVVGVNVQISRENIFSKATPSSVIQTLYRLHQVRQQINTLDQQSRNNRNRGSH